MRLIIRGEVTPIERIAINEALEAHKKKYNRTKKPRNTQRQTNHSDPR
ncbi:DUF4060 family protein [Proteus penneri]|nr:DUF4060 family protein [Proteus penneri]